jgi:hypothetical protein
MTKRATERPEPFSKPARWSSAPPPEPQPAALRQVPDERDEEELSPTRYGDWVRNGIAVDF